MTRSTSTGGAMLRSGLIVGLACWLAACASKPDNAGEVIARASAAMGTAQAKSLRYVAEGTGYTFGQAFKPGGAWPRITLHSVTRTIDYDTGAMRDEIVLSRAEPQGGGGYPLSGQQRNDQFVSGDLAWNQAATGAVPGPRFVADRVHQLWITPHGVLRAVHSDGFLMVYLPNEKLLIEADAFTPGAPNAPPPPVPNANNLNLIDNIERLGLKVDRILPLHGRVVALSELYTTAGKALPAR
jgi:hypothetical protein